MSYRCNAAKIREIVKIRSKIAQVKSLSGCGTSKKFNILTILNYLLIFILVFFLRDIRLCHRCYPQMDAE